ncbi:MAG: enoyl-CoA hydratase [Rhodobacteraceae bacterium]|nr:enoyl-CoA hydratase [Paracoccaceae bacterium]MBR28676.1 enoyl-CoA hydratase [Paracoccaceae bacterium]
MTDYTQIIYDVTDRVATIRFNRPDRLNAYTGTMADELRAAISEASADAGVRAIVMTGEGRGFCAGADMEVLQGIGSSGGEITKKAAEPDFSAAPGPDVTADFPGRFGYMFACPKPIIAAINGPCAGIGMVLALFADLRFAAAEARFTTAFSARGLVAEHGMAWLLPRLVGEANALDLLLTSRKFDGTEAQALGLVNKAIPGADLMAHVHAVAKSMADEVSPRSMAVMKRQVRASYHQSFAESLTAADAEMDGSFKAPDFKEGVQSFVEKRPPAFASV